MPNHNELCSHGRSLYSDECNDCDAIWHRDAIALFERKLVEHRAALARIEAEPSSKPRSPAMEEA